MKIAAFNGKTWDGKKSQIRRSFTSSPRSCLSTVWCCCCWRSWIRAGKAMQRLLKELNKISSNRNSPFSMTSTLHAGTQHLQGALRLFLQYEDVQVGDVDASPESRSSCASAVPPQELDELHDVVDSSGRSGELITL
ncbi:hypothetical protein KUCAC02_036001 [Chaenocephalus aceratus]|nr:hypothetical protein KUCAC02_036001 [Chaenocephalus aceratus]